MRIRALDHINIGTTRLDETVAFFRDLLGLTPGWRPSFPFGGAWLYAGETAVVHLIVLNEPRSPSGGAAMDHAAFRIDDLDAMAARLDAAAVPYRRVQVPGAPIRQIFVQDPNGVTIELNERP